MSRLFDITLAAAALLKPLDRGSSTGGSTTTLVDTANPQPTGYYDGGILWVFGNQYTTTVEKILSWSATTHAFTIQLQSSPILSQTPYAAIPPSYTVAGLTDALNRALSTIGFLITRHTLDDDTVAGQAEYSLTHEQDGTVYRDVRQVMISDANGANWKRSFYWREVDGQLVFVPGHEPQTTGGTIQVTHLVRPDEVEDPLDEIDDAISAERLAWQTAYNAAWGRKAYSANNDPYTTEFLTKAEGKLAELAIRFPLPLLSRDPLLG